MTNSKFDTEDDVASELTTVIDDPEATPIEEPDGPRGVTYGVSVQGADLCFKIDNKTIKKVPVKSLKGFDSSSLDSFREITSEFRVSGLESAISKFKK